MNIVSYLPKFLKSVIVFLLVSNVAVAQIPACSTYVLQTYNESYTYLSGGSSINLQSDDITVRFIPIGFTFMFCGNNYTQLSACSNGWISLSNSSSTSFSNSSASSMSGIAPMLMPLFDDLYGGNGGYSSYSTTGAAPNRVFTMEWRYWRPLSYTSSSQISFQVRLYEGTNAIKFHYKKEGTSPLPSGTIGIGYAINDYKTLPNSGTSPIPSSTIFTTNITTYPAVGQVYEWDPPIPCDPSTNLVMNSYNSQGAAFSWTGVTGAGSYDYAVDNSSTLAPATATVITNTAVTNGTANGLTPSTTYYLHVRTRCSPVSISQWDTISFRTLPPCSKPSGFQVTYIDSNSANFLWTPASNALQYHYIVDKSINTPTSTSPMNSTTVSFVSLPDTCKDGELYYVHIRAKCVSNDSSLWSLDSFRVPVPCRKPGLVLSYLSSENSIVTWKAVPTAVNYEYYLGPVSTLPAAGTPIIPTSIQTPYLVPNTEYTMNVRCNCSFYGVKTVSDWSSIEYKTLSPTDVARFPAAKINITFTPNPVKDILHVSVQNNNGMNVLLTITDVTGKMHRTFQIDASEKDIDMKDFASGVYFVRYQCNDELKIIKIVKD